jgi:hypothetical protein
LKELLPPCTGCSAGPCESLLSISLLPWLSKAILLFLTLPHVIYTQSCADIHPEQIQGVGYRRITVLRLFPG